MRLLACSVQWVIRRSRFTAAYRPRSLDYHGRVATAAGDTPGPPRDPSNKISLPHSHWDIGWDRTKLCSRSARTMRPMMSVSWSRKYSNTIMCSRITLKKNIARVSLAHTVNSEFDNVQTSQLLGSVNAESRARREVT